MAKPITENAQMQCTLGAAPVPLTVTNESGSKRVYHSQNDTPTHYRSCFAKKRMV